MPKIKKITFLSCVLVVFSMNVNGKVIQNNVADNQRDSVLNYLFQSGMEGYNTFRIPALVTTTSGRILAFAEGRVNGRSDTGNIDLVMKYSDNDGKSWSPLIVVWDDGENVCGNPAPVVDTQTGDIYLLMTWNLGQDHEHQIIDGESKDTRRVFVSHSSDNGESWSIPLEITPSVKKFNWTWYATGPCHGIQLNSKKYRGRLVIPCDHIEAGTKKYYSHTIYSDDHGKSWHLGGTTPQDQVNECTVAELADGRLLLNMRNYDRTQKVRKQSYSSDGGVTWGDIQPIVNLPEPICQASILSIKNGNKLLFLNPASSDSRTNMTLKVSSNNGKTWKIIRVLHEGPSAYSDLVLGKHKKLYCLYEAGIDSPYEGIVFESVIIK
ncbi:MAG: exo-alpha-sialidase [Draconibacterium sp.]|nr:MAG: exo-alpha-sialidase [Draconibacterium sp.]